MTFYTRQGTAPIEEGDALNAAEVEAEFDSIQSVINGALDTANLSSSAGIVGSQLATGTVPESRIVPGTLTTASLNVSATMKAFVESHDGAGTILPINPIEWRTLPLFVGTTLTPGSAQDMLAMDCTVTMSNDTRIFDLGFSISGIDSEIPVARKNGSFSASWSWMVAANSKNPVTVLPRYRVSSINTSSSSVSMADGVLATFRAFVIPIK